MRRGVPILLVVLVVVLGGGFLALMWVDMRHSVAVSRGQRPPEAPEGPRERRPRGERPERKQDRPGGESCSEAGIPCASQYFADWEWPADGSCRQTVRNGLPEPDGRCTPGGVVPGVTVETLRDPAWRTKCTRNCQSSEAQKHVTYEWYGMERPEDNNGARQVCELDHLVPLELGGADGLGNIWPQCGPDGAALRERYFKQKDVVENYLAARVRAGDMDLGAAQRGIAADWVQYLEAARAACRGNRC